MGSGTVRQICYSMGQARTLREGLWLGVKVTGVAESEDARRNALAHRDGRGVTTEYDQLVTRESDGGEIDPCRARG